VDVEMVARVTDRCHVHSLGASTPERACTSANEDADLGRFTLVEIAEIGGVTLRHDYQMAEVDVAAIDGRDVAGEREVARLKGTSGEAHVTTDFAAHHAVVPRHDRSS
jgi:hypothetical protein